MLGVGIAIPVGRNNTPVWTGQAGRAMLTLIKFRSHGAAFYGLHVIENGHDAQVAVAHEYPIALCAVQTWTEYLNGGGTLRDWLWIEHDKAQAQS